MSKLFILLLFILASTQYSYTMTNVLCAACTTSVSDPCQPCATYLEDGDTIKAGWSKTTWEKTIWYKNACPYIVKFKVRDCDAPESRQIRIEGIVPENPLCTDFTRRTMYPDKTDCEYLWIMQDMLSSILSGFVWWYATENSPPSPYQTLKVLMPSCIELYGGAFTSPIRILPESSTYSECTPSCCLRTLKYYLDECNILRLVESASKSRTTYECLPKNYTMKPEGASMDNVKCFFGYAEGFVNCIPMCDIKITTLKR